MSATAIQSIASRLAPMALAAMLLVANAAPCSGQSSRLYTGELAVEGAQRPPLIRDWYSVPAPPPKEIRLHDIINVRVDIASIMQSDGEMERRKNSLYDAILKDWVILDGLRWIKPSPQSDGDPRVQGQKTELFRAEGELETAELLKFQIAAEVVDIRPNGNLVIEAHQQIVNNEESWDYSLSGICRREDIQPGNFVLSDNIYSLKVTKRERGMVRDSYRRGWFLRWFDEFHWF